MEKLIEHNFISEPDYKIFLNSFSLTIGRKKLRLRPRIGLAWRETPFVATETSD